MIKIPKEEMDYKLEELFDCAKSTDVAFLYRGDILVSAHHLLEKIKKGCEKYNIPLEIIPGVSSVIKGFTRD